MSQTKMRREAERWLATAEQDLSAARVLRGSGHCAHACFLAQQAAEKAVKALWYLRDADPWGHSAQRLVLEIPDAGQRESLRWAVEPAAYLDRFYIPTRYPNGLPDLTPGENFFPSDADEALRQAGEIYRACAALVEAG